MEITQIGPYRLEDRLGSGGMGVVYRAYDERLDRQVAIKLVSADKTLDSKARERLRREAKASARLSHPAIVQTYDWIEADGTDAIVMELVEGTSLHDLLRKGPFDPPRALAVARQIAEALAEAHGKGIVHRDLKTENVLLTPGGHAKVLDFGIAKRLDPSQTDLTAVGAVVGTCRAMAPEQAQGQEVDHRADLFAFGTLLYEMVTGQSPFLDANAAATVWRVCSHRQKPARTVNPQVPVPLSALIDQLLEKQPHLRPESAQAVAAALGGMATGTRVQRPPEQETIGYGGSTAVEIPSAASAHLSAERRQMTILYCGIVRTDGRPLDPEEILLAMPPLRRTAAEILQRFGGLLRPAISEGFLGVFGYPRAHEDDVRRAVFAALELTDCVRRQGPSLATRIGIHTGSMVIPRGSESEIDLSGGDTPNVAALLQRLAPPGAVLASAEAHRLAGGFLQCEALEPAHLPGSPEPLQAYRVLADSGAHTRIAIAKALTPLVGREQELSLLLSRWALVQEGRGQVVLVAGEAGLGKSRLLWELRQRVAAGAAVWLESWASPFFVDSAFYAVRQWLQQWLGEGEEEAPEARLARLETALASHELSAAELVPLLAPLLSIPTGERYAPPPLSPDARRRKTLEALLAVFVTAADRQPLLLVMEDLHWTDPSSRELLGLLIEHVPGSSLLLLLTFRPEFQTPWGDPSYLARLTLGPLTHAQTCQMIEQLTPDRRLDTGVREAVALRTDGVPLFVEELTRMILESHRSTGAGRGERSGSQASLEIPATLEGWLSARLDRLETAREVAQAASVIGREFSFELLQAVSPWSDLVLEMELNRLIEAEIVYKRGRGLKQHYVFKHALLQDAAYSSLLRSDRQKHHRRVAEALESRFPETVREHPELVARHFTEAGLPDKALPYWQRASQEAYQSCALREAADYAVRALAVLQQLPATTERDRQEMELQLGFAESWGRCVSQVAPESLAALSRALEICHRIGSRLQLVRVQRALLASYVVSGQLRQALELGQQCYDLMQLEENPLLRNSVAHRFGSALLGRGELARAREILQEGAAISVDPLDPVHFDPAAGHSDVYSEINLAWTLWLLGLPEQAVQHCRQALGKAEPIAFAYTLGFAQYFAMIVYSQLGEMQVVAELADRQVALGKDSALLMWEYLGLFFRSWAAFQHHPDPDLLPAMQAILDGVLERRGLFGLPSNLALLVEAYRRAGCLTEAAAVLDTAIAVSHQGEQTVVDAELHRLRGELIAAQQGTDEEIEPWFEEALAIARRQQARSLELRAAMSLARHWRGRDRRGEARELLQGVYGAFTEGFDTRDLREARALLDELS